MQGSGGCLRQSKIIGYLRWVIIFWIFEVKQDEQTIANIRGRVTIFLFRSQISSFREITLFLAEAKVVK